MKIRTSMTVDLWAPAPPPCIYVKQGDSEREIAVALLSDGIQITPDVTPNVYIKKPDGTLVYNACTLNGGTVIIPLTTQSVAAEGEAMVELEMITSDGTLSTPIFMLIVLPTNIDSSAIESSNEFGALTEAIQEVEDLKENGLKGDPGKAATIQVGTVTTGAAGTQASVSNSGTENDAVLDFVIPRGDKGAAGTVTADTDAIVTYETPDTYTAPTSGNTLGTWLGRATKGLADLFAGLAIKLDKSKALNTYAEIMAATEAGFWPDVLAVKDGFEQLNTKLSTSSGTITWMSNISNNTSLANCRKYGNVVVLNFTFNTLAAITSGTPFITLPSGYRPSDNVYFVVKQAGSQTNEVNATINTKGEVSSINLSLTANAYYVGQATFII